MVNIEDRLQDVKGMDCNELIAFAATVYMSAIDDKSRKELVKAMDLRQMELESVVSPMVEMSEGDK